MSVTRDTEPIDELARIQEASFARASPATAGAFPPERRMDAAALTAFLTGRRYGVLSTVRPDGRPHAAPTGYALVGARFVIATLAEAQRVQNIRHAPHCSLVVTEGEGHAHAAVIVEGTARLLAPLEAPLEMRAPFRDAAGSFPGWVGLLITVTPERILSYAGEGFGS